MAGVELKWYKLIMKVHISVVDIGSKDYQFQGFGEVLYWSHIQFYM